MGLTNVERQRLWRERHKDEPRRPRISKAAREQITAWKTRAIELETVITGWPDPPEGNGPAAPSSDPNYRNGVLMAASTYLAEAFHAAALANTNLAELRRIPKQMAEPVQRIIDAWTKVLHRIDRKAAANPAAEIEVLRARVAELEAELA